MKKFARKNGGMKRCAAVLLAAMTLFATGCGDEEKTIDGSVQNIQPEEIGDEAGGGASGTGQAGQTQGGGTGSGTAAGSSVSGGKGYTFSYNGTVIEIDADAAPILDKLGDPVSYFEAPSCAFEGMDKTYTYNGFELDTYPTGDRDFVSTVVLKDDSVTTPEGICIGDTREKLLQAYPDGGTEENGMLVYEKDGMKLCFIIKGDEVASIEYRSTVLN